MFRIWLVLVVLFASICGCAPWDAGSGWKSDAWHRPAPVSGQDETLRLPASRMAKDSVTLEIAVGQLDLDQQGEVGQFWAEVDQQVLPFEVRQRLDQNGLLAGVVASQPPAILHRLLQDKVVDTSAMEPWQVQFIEQGNQTTVSRMILHQRIQNGAGESHCVPVSDIAPQASWIVHDGSRQTAGEGEQARGFIRLRTYPAGDSSLRLVVTPEIRYGRQQASFGVAEGSFTYSAKQSMQVLSELKFETRLKPGQTLVLGANPQLSDLGGFLFGPTDNAEFGQRVILVRLVHSQRDDLFDSRVDHVSTNGL